MQMFVVWIVWDLRRMGDLSYTIGAQFACLQADNGQNHNMRDSEAWKIAKLSANAS